MRAAIFGMLAAGAFAAGVLTGGAAAHALDGDVNGDCNVNTLDLYLVGARYGASWGSLLYSPQYDLNGDRQIDVKDLQMVAARFGTTC
jgi:hypothetical protein